MYWWGQWNTTSGFSGHIIKFFKHASNLEFFKDTCLINLFLLLWLTTSKTQKRTLVIGENIKKAWRACTHLWTRDGGAKTPCFGGQLKYLTPPTDPSFFPLGLSSLMPNQSPAQSKRQSWNLDGLWPKIRDLPFKKLFKQLVKKIMLWRSDVFAIAR